MNDLVLYHKIKNKNEYIIRNALYNFADSQIVDTFEITGIKILQRVTFDSEFIHLVQY